LDICSFEAPHFHFNAQEFRLAGQNIVLKALCSAAVSAIEVVAQVQSKAPIGEAAAKANTLAVRVLVHAIIAGALPQIYLVLVLKREDKGLACSVERIIAFPLLVHHRPEFVAILILHQHQSRLFSRCSLEESVH